MSELIPRITAKERSPEAEATSQAEYVQDLAAHVESIPDISKLPAGYFPSIETSKLLASYCANYHHAHAKVEELGFSPLFHKDIISPNFCQSVDELTMKITGNSSSSHWYATVEVADMNYLTKLDQAKYTSRKWELVFIDYIRQRYAFHAAFMNTLLTKEPIDEHVAAIGYRDGEPIQIPSVDINSSRKQPAPEFMYSRANWLTGSLLSALALPPWHCDANMKRHAVEQWANHIDLADISELKGFYHLDKLAHVTQVPWSMRSNAELQPSHTIHWRENRIIQRYFGEFPPYRADAFDALLQERPKDYIQVLILQIFVGYGADIQAWQSLVRTAQLPSEIKDIIFAEDAAFNTVHQEMTLPEFNQPTTLFDLLNGNFSAQAQETIIAGQRLRIHVLTEELAHKEEALATLIADKDTLEARNRDLEAIFNQQSPHLPRSNADLLMLQFGISPNMDNELLPAVITAIRHRLSRKLHTDNAQTADEDRLKEVNASLDDILKSRGLNKNQS